MLHSLTLMNVRRLQMGMTQTALAREVKTVQTSISLMERRYIPVPEKLAPKIAKLLDVDVADLMMDYDEWLLREQGRDR